jgi:hypothetical protein
MVLTLISVGIRYALGELAGVFMDVCCKLLNRSSGHTLGQLSPYF